MNDKWQSYADKFLDITPREQYLIILTGLVIIVFGFFNFAIDGHLTQNAKLTKQITKISSSIKSANITIKVLEEGLTIDPNVRINKRIARLEKKITSVDSDLLALTSGLINPIEMRYALVDLLKLEKGVKISSFEVLSATPLNIDSSKNESKQIKSKDDKSKHPVDDALLLYKHGIKLVLKGEFFQLRDYLQQLEQLQWQFFWQQFNYQLLEYPKGELHIEMYSLSTKKEFVGV